MPETGRLINNRNLVLKVLDAGESKIKVLADSVSGDSQSWLTATFFSVPFHGRDIISLMFLFIRH